jgi:hypothetical protein
MVNTSGRDVKRQWPIHECIRDFDLREPVALPPAKTFLFAAANLRKAIMGSSASNLYRSEILHARPFPTDYGTAGDFGWILRHAAELTLGIVPEVFSTFVFHPKSYAKADYAVDNFKRKCLATIRESMQSPAGEAIASAAPALTDAARISCDAWETFLDAREQAAAQVSGKWFWFLSSRARIAMRTQRQALHRHEEAQRAALQLIFRG